MSAERPIVAAQTHGQVLCVSRSGVSQFFEVLTAPRPIPPARETTYTLDKGRLSRATVADCVRRGTRASERGQVERAQAVVTAPHDERAQRRWRVESIASRRKDSGTVRIQAQAGWEGEARDQMSVSRKLLLLRLARDLAPTSRSSGTDDAPRTSLKVGIDSAAGAAILRIEGGVKREDLVDLGSLADQRPTLHEPPLRSSRPLAFLASGDVRQGSYAMR
jgi:hypothetical protein